MSKLYNLVTNEDMINLNYQVDFEKKDPKDVAHEFLKQHGLVK